MNYGLVSVIMPAYNSSKTIEKSIQSVLKQKYTKLELIIVNDGSNDETINVIKKHMLKDERIVLIDRQHNKGISESRNQAISIAKGEWIAFLDSDDIWYEDKLSIQLDEMERLNVKFCCTSYKINDGKKIKAYRKKTGFYEYSDLLKSNIVGCLTVLASSSLLSSHSFPEIKHEDYALWLEILSEEDVQLYFFDYPLSCYNKMDKSVSSNKLRSVLWALKVIESQNNLTYFTKRKSQLLYLLGVPFKYIFS